MPADTTDVASLRRLTLDRPFPGPYPYREDDAGAGYFCGRVAETGELLRLIRRNVLTVLFGASGLGKSSLLSAGLFPELRKQGYLPVPVKLRYDTRGDAGAVSGLNLTRQIMADVRGVAERHGVEVEHGEDRSTLWAYFQHLELWSPSAQMLTAVVVLDQFEETFTLGAQSSEARTAVTELFASLADLVENRMPRELTESRRGGASLAEIRSAVEFGDRQPLVKVVVCLREEYLPHLEALRRDMPSLGRSRMRLLPFNGLQATATLVESAPHLLTPLVAERIVRGVAGGPPAVRAAAPGPIGDAERPLEELVVEPSLLNLFCYQLNERRLNGGPAAAAARAASGLDSIGAALVSASGNDILSDFYHDCLRGLGGKVREFVERRLLSPSGYRLPVPRQDALAEPGIDDRVLLTLEGRRLIRQEMRQDATYVQLVHDVLAHPILQSRARRKLRVRLRRLWGGLCAAVAFALAGIGFVTYQVRTKGDEAYLELNPRLSVARADLARLHGDYEALRGELDTTRGEARKTAQALTHSRIETETAKREKDAATHLMLQANAKAEQAEQRVRSAEARLSEVAHGVSRLEQKRAELSHTIQLLEAQVGIPHSPE